MKQISVRVDDDFAFKFKVELLKRGTSAQEVLKTYLESWLVNNTEPNLQTSEQVKTSHVNKLTTTTSEQVSMLTRSHVNTPTEETHFIIRKTAKTRTETQNRIAQLGPYQWFVMEGNKSHYDKDNNIIPIRFTAPDGQVCEPDEDEIKELEEAFGKPVHIEK